MKPIVIDNPVVLAWCLAHEAHPVAERAMRLAVEHGAVVPGIWRHKSWNPLIVNERRGRLTAEDARQVLGDLAELCIERDGDHDEAPLLALARRWGLSAHDAAYLEVAARRRLAIASLDSHLAEAAAGANLPLVGHRHHDPFG